MSSNLHWYVLGGLALGTGVLLVAHKGASSAAPGSIADPALRAKVTGTISTLQDPVQLRTLAAGLRKDGSLVEAAQADAKAATLEAALASLAQIQSALPSAVAAQVAASKESMLAAEIHRGESAVNHVPPTIGYGYPVKSATPMYVRLWQGYLRGPGGFGASKTLVANGVFDLATKVTTQLWQNRHGLLINNGAQGVYDTDPPGVVGPQTWLKATELGYNAV